MYLLIYLFIYLLILFYLLKIYFIGIHFMQDWTATTSHNSFRTTTKFSLERTYS